MGYNFMNVDNSVDNLKMSQKTNVLSEWIVNKADVYNKYKTEGQQWKEDRFDKQKGYSFWLSANAVRMFPNGFELPKDINASMCGYLFRCAMMLQPKTNKIVKHYKNYDKPLDREMLIKELGISERHFYRFFKIATEKHIIKECDKELYMNPLFFMCGRYLTHQLYTLFQEDLDAFLPQWVIDRFNGDVNA
jgi:AraC-like DNA-binding protein